MYEVFTARSGAMVPSLDPACLTVMLIGFKWNVMNLYHQKVVFLQPILMLAGILPILKDSEAYIFGLRDIIKYLNDKNEELECLAYNNIIEQVCLDIISKYWLGDVLEEKLENDNPSFLITRQRVPKTVKKPEFTIRRDILELASRRVGVRNDIFQDTRKLYMILEKKLRGEYFFGDFPSDTDAYIAGHLILHADPFSPGGELYFILDSECPRLLKYLVKLRSKLFNQTNIEKHLYPDKGSRFKNLLSAVSKTIAQKCKFLSVH